MSIVCCAIANLILVGGILAQSSGSPGDRPVDGGAGGAVLVYEMDKDWWSMLSREERAGFEIRLVAGAVKRRIDPKDMKDVVVRPIDAEGNDPPRVEIILPVTKNGVIKQLIAQTAGLEFRQVADKQDEPDVFNDASKSVNNWMVNVSGVPPAPAATKNTLVRMGGAWRSGGQGAGLRADPSGQR